MTEEADVRVCEECGGPVVYQKTATGVQYPTPLSNEFFLQQMQLQTSDYFILDRLRRAERIITELREELSAYKKNSSGV